MKTKYYLMLNLIMLLSLLSVWSVEAQFTKSAGVKYIDCYFENASPLNWNIQGDSAIKIDLMYNYERESVNRASGHWYFKVEAEKGTELNLILSNMVNIYNGKKTSFVGNKEQFLACYFSEDQENWSGVPTLRLSNNLDFQVKYTMKEDYVYIARIPPYTEKNLEKLKTLISGTPLVHISIIGHTFEKRPLEMIRVGNPDARYRILLRARAHAWEAGGSWVVEGLIDKFLQDTNESRKWQEQICYYIMPMTNKDGIYRGMTRFNVAGKDLNRDWMQEPDAVNAPEKLALENFLKELIREGKKPVFAMDFHNDDYGMIHLTVPKSEDKKYMPKMELLQRLLTEQTFHSQRLYMNKNTVGVMADGMYHRYGIDACILELNANYIEKLDKIPEIADWIGFGEKLNGVFAQYVNYDFTN